MNLKLSREEKIKILNAEDLYGVMQQILKREDKIDQDREHFWIVGLNSRNRILFIELIGLGTVRNTLADPMDVFSFALQKRTVSIILVHNHPSGELEPSPEDEDLTDRLIQVGKIVNVRVLDHLVISPKTYFSFSNEGLMDVLSQSTKYEPNYVTIERLTKQATELGRQLGQKEMATRMKQDGVDVELIVKYTGLSQEDIEAL